MADVLIVCVREDEPRAKALAEMFEAAGFSIGGAPSTDGALRSTGAGVVVWSQAAIRSRPFLDAAQRVINADKAVVASLIDPPPPSSVGNAATFDLSRWDGDPNDSSLDPLFFAVDRMVNASRVGATGPASAPSPYEEPAHRASARIPPAPRPAPPPPAPTSSSPDPINAEAEHWRAIRDSRDASVFLDYLTRYGPQGTFAEVAEIRLQQLTASQPAAKTQTPRPSVRLDPPQQRRQEPPQRRADPPPRRADAAPSQRRAPPPERTYERDLHEPPRGQGGPLRTIILIALLGGAALAGGLYFGGGLNDNANAPPAIETADAGAGPPPDAPADSFQQEGVGLSEAIDERPVQMASRETPRPVEREATREAAREPDSRDLNSATSTPTPSGGPISLSPGSQLPNTGAVPLGPQPLSPQPGLTEPAPLPAASTPPQRTAPGAVVFAQRPTARRIADLYPDAAARQGVGGRVQLNCTVLSNLSLECTIASESPAGVGFGRAALSASSAYRARATLSDGANAVGSTTRIAVAFQAPS